MARVIDSHQHFWNFSRDEYGWIDQRMGVLARDFTPDDLAAARLTAGVDGSIAVQARQSVAETEWLLQLAEQDPSIVGVVGWLPLVSPDLPVLLERFLADRKLVGLRHVVQDEPDDRFLLRDDFNRGVRLLSQTGLTYDVLIFARQLPAAIEFADRHSDLELVLDHVGKPAITTGEMDSWRHGIDELALRSNVTCKVSGMVTEADWHAWRPEQLKPYFDVVVEAFGPGRLMFGSDWPVCLLGTTYQVWFELLQTWTADWTSSEREQFFGGTACRVYGTE